MTSVVFDPLALFDSLKKAGLSDEDADIFVEAFKKISERNIAKGKTSRARNEFNHSVNGEFKPLRQEIKLVKEELEFKLIVKLGIIFISIGFAIATFLAWFLPIAIIAKLHP
jgi:hypothetical protein